MLRRINNNCVIRASSPAEIFDYRIINNYKLVPGDVLPGRVESSVCKERLNRMLWNILNLNILVDSLK